MNFRLYVDGRCISDSRMSLFSSRLRCPGSAHCYRVTELIIAYSPVTWQPDAAALCSHPKLHVTMSNFTAILLQPTDGHQVRMRAINCRTKPTKVC
jgi:hypothetical protein